MSIRLSLLAAAVMLSGCVTGTVAVAHDRYYYDAPRYNRYYYPPPPPPRVYYRPVPEYRPVIIYRERPYHRPHWRDERRNWRNDGRW